MSEPEVVELNRGDDEEAGRLRTTGYRPEAEVWHLTVAVGPGTRAPSWPAGIRVRTWEDGDAPAVHALLAAAFAGSRERVPPYEGWHAWFAADASFEPSTCFLAEAASGLAGVALCWREGFVKDLAVMPDWRRRGLGEALLRHVFRVFAARGAGEVSLKVDAANPTGAIRLYERLGMSCTRRTELWRR